MNKINKEIYEEIKALSCFVNHNCRIEPLTGGESHACFKVTFSQNSLEEVSCFVKSLAGHQETAIAEIASNLLAAEAGLAPAIIYHSPLWLVCEFIIGDSLANFINGNLAHVSINKIMVAMNLMVKTHQLKPSENHQILDIERLLVRQKNQQHVTSLQHVALNITISKIVPLQAEHIDLVLCHGDINYENIRLSDSFKENYSLEKTWLVDYECSYLAEAEYDIAMFIAVNELCVEDIDTVINSYNQYSTVEVKVSINIDKAKVRTYLACCYLINGLWYFEAAAEGKQDQTLLAKARQQFNLFDQLELLAEKVAPLF
jgi:thiamine kinase-like enzyme